TNNIPAIRIGLQPTSSLIEKDVILDGPFHPALRQLIESEIAYDMMRYAIYRSQKSEARSQKLKHGTFFTSSIELSNFIGQRRANLKRLESETGLKVAVKADAGLESGKVIFDNGFKKIYIERKDWLRDAVANIGDF
ncbi:MAG: hypothetical protein HY279_13655, partial [Nitrospinae bacterium]|nr:hypothetical protein [Nitrospinota bacterium]